MIQAQRAVAGESGTSAISEMPMDTSENGQVFIVSRDGETYVRLSARARVALQLAERGASRAEMADELGNVLGRAVREDDAEAFCAHVAQKCEKLFERGTRTDHAFLFKLPLLSARVATALSRPFRLAFGVVPAACALLVCSIGLPLGFAGGSRIAAGNDWQAGLLAYGLFLLSSLAHELGHASACLRFGVRPRTIGFTVYAMFPAFYTDVTDAWLLKRAQRVVVDLGGSYFQLVVGAVYGLLYAATSAKSLHWATLMILTATVFNLNPLFKFDGYWIVADALGVTNLAACGRSVLRALVAGNRSAMASWPRPICALLIVYGAVSTSMWALFTIFIVKSLWTRVPWLRTVFSDIVVVAGGRISVHWALVPSAAIALGATVLSLAFLARTAQRGATAVLRATAHGKDAAP